MNLQQINGIFNNRIDIEYLVKEIAPSTSVDSACEKASMYIIKNNLCKKKQFCDYTICYDTIVKNYCDHKEEMFGSVLCTK